MPDDVLIIPAKIFGLSVLVIQKRLGHTGVKNRVVYPQFFRDFTIIGVHHIHGYPELDRLAVDVLLRPHLLCLLHAPVRTHAAISILHFRGPLLCPLMVNGLKTMVLKEVKAGKGFRDLNTYGTYLEHLLTPEAKIRLLEQELAYKDQIIEYLKKIMSLGQAETE